jgi:protein-tyrosine phosphatase
MTRRHCETREAARPCPAPTAYRGDVTIHDLPNGRDLGGTRAAGGSVRPGLLLRTAAPSDDAQARAIAELGVTHIVDLRTKQERAKLPSVLPDGATLVLADVLADATYAAAANLGQLASQALQGDGAADRLAKHDLGAIMIDSYRDFARLASAKDATRRTLELLADPGTGPVIIHCTAGKDRTGWIVAVILRILGASRDDIMADYLLSGPTVRELFAEYLAALPPDLRSRDALAPAIGVFPEYLDAAFEWTELTHPSFEAYVRDGLGVGDDTVAALRRRLLQSSSDSTFA